MAHPHATGQLALLCNLQDNRRVTLVALPFEIWFFNSWRPVKGILPFGIYLDCPMNIPNYIPFKLLSVNLFGHHFYDVLGTPKTHMYQMSCFYPQRNDFSYNPPLLKCYNFLSTFRFIFSSYILYVQKKASTQHRQETQARVCEQKYREIQQMHTQVIMLDYAWNSDSLRHLFWHWHAGFISSISSNSIQARWPIDTPIRQVCLKST